MAGGSDVFILLATVQFGQGLVLSCRRALVWLRGACGSPDTCSSHLAGHAGRWPGSNLENPRVALAWGLVFPRWDLDWGERWEESEGGGTGSADLASLALGLPRGHILLIKSGASAEEAGACRPQGALGVSRSGCTALPFEESW